MQVKWQGCHFRHARHDAAHAGQVFRVAHAYMDVGVRAKQDARAEWTRRASHWERFHFVPFLLKEKGPPPEAKNNPSNLRARNKRNLAGSER